MDNIVGLPFEMEQTEYTSYWQEMAQVSYTREGQTLIYRKSVGKEDNSGNYTNYQNAYIPAEVSRDREASFEPQAIPKHTIDVAREL